MHNELERIEPRGRDDFDIVPGHGVVVATGGATPTGTAAANREKRSEYERYAKNEGMRLATRRCQKQCHEGNHSCAVYPL